jgi:hypothetical protein
MTRVLGREAFDNQVERLFQWMAESTAHDIVQDMGIEQMSHPEPRVFGATPWVRTAFG